MSSTTRRQQIEAMLQDDPNDSFLWYGLAMEQLSAGEHEAALGTFNELRRRSPDYVPAYVQAGQLLARLDREEEARAVYQIGIAAARRKGDQHAAGEMEGFLDALG